MTRFCLALALWLACSVAAAGQASSEEWRLSPRSIRDGVRATVENQLAAFRAEDFARAYRHASPALQRQFTLPVFEAMIRRGYPALVRHRSAELGVVRDLDGRRAAVTVLVVSHEGEPVRFRYLLVLENDAWRVAGVTVDRRPPSRPDA